MSSIHTTPQQIYSYLTARGWHPSREQGEMIYGCCPVHPDHKPSFRIDARGWKCFSASCNRAGDLTRLVLYLEYPQFGDNPTRGEWYQVYTRVGEIIGQPVQQQQQQQKMSSISSSSLQHATAFASEEQQAVMSVALEWWHNQLYHTRGKPARVWLAQQGITTLYPYPEQIGYAPSMQDVSTFNEFDHHMKEGTRRNLGGKVRDWRELGISTGILYTNGMPRLSQRLIFASCNKEGKVMSYSGRSVLTDEQRETYQQETGREIQKYLLAPSLRKVPFWLPIARPALPGTLIVESPKGPLTLAQDSLYTLATLGPGFQPWMLSFCRVGEPLYVMTDHDEGKVDTRTGEVTYPGERIAQEVIQAAQQAGGWTEVYRVLPPKVYKDPDTWRRMCGPQPILDAVQQAQRTQLISA